MTLKRYPKIDNLKKHLDQTAPDHNGLPFWVFEVLVGPDVTKPIVDKANLARAFNVHRDTIYRWLQLLIIWREANVKAD